MSTSPLYSRKNPFSAPLLKKERLTSPSSDKEVYHYEFSLAGSGLIYEPGDCAALFPQNDPLLVDEILLRLGFSGEELVSSPQGETLPLADALLHYYSITEPSAQFLKEVLSKSSHSPLPSEDHPEYEQQIKEYLSAREIIDPLLEHPDRSFTPEEFISLLRKLQPRLYSISSSPLKHEEEVHLTVATLSYKSLGRHRKGVCSHFLAYRLEEQEQVPLFIHAAKHFRLPQDHSTPLIMVGPGTGIAPFRSFLHHREVLGGGKQWLFFGSRSLKEDFLYSQEIEEWLKKGVLTHLSTAFSRDQRDKIYVQHRLLEASKEVYSWLEEGAFFYLCGEANFMAKAVEEALVTIIQKERDCSLDQAQEYLQGMKKEKRYRKDVY